MVFSPAFRAEHYSGGLIATLGSLWSSLWLIAFIAIGVVTSVFVLLEQVQTQTGFLEAWDPNRLPAVHDPNRIPRFSSITELVVGMLFMVWWVNSLWSQTVFSFSGVTVTVTAGWRYFFWSILLLSLVNIAMAAISLFRPYWTRLRASIRLASDCAGSALFCWLVKSDILVGLAVPNVAPAKTVVITNAINMWMSRAFPIAVAIGVVIAAFDVHRIIRVKATDTGSIRDVAAVFL
jgi:hypothetical protein